MFKPSPRALAYALIARAFNPRSAGYDPETMHDALAEAVRAGCKVTATSSPAGLFTTSTVVYTSAWGGAECGADPAYWEKNAEWFNYVEIDGRVLTGHGATPWPTLTAGFTF